jgi:hypothetical protein
MEFLHGVRWLTGRRLTRPLAASSTMFMIVPRSGSACRYQSPPLRNAGIRRIVWKSPAITAKAIASPAYSIIQ